MRNPLKFCFILLLGVLGSGMFTPVFAQVFGDNVVIIRNQLTRNYLCSSENRDGGAFWMESEIPEDRKDQFRFRLEATRDANVYRLKHVYSDRYLFSDQDDNGARFSMVRTIPRGNSDQFSFRISPGSGSHLIKHMYSDKYLFSDERSERGAVWMSSYPRGETEAFEFLLFHSNEDPGEGLIAYNAADCPSCSTTQNNEMDRIVRNQQGIHGSDPVSHRIGPYAAEKIYFGRNWYPMDGFKHTLCGTLYDFRVHDGSFIFFGSNEKDWNNFIAPDPAYRYLVDDVLRWEPDLDDRNDEWHTHEGRYTMEGEITPPEGLFRYPPFNLVTRTSSIEGRNVCTYGPWVREEVHANRPEIHPSEQYWWGSDRIKYMLLLQDNSNRYNERSDFRDIPDRGFKPWASSPLSGEFRIPFKVNIGEETHKYSVQIEYKSKLVTRDDAEASRDVGAGRRYAVTKNFQAPIIIEEWQAVDEDIGVMFEEVCYNSSTNEIRGYIVLNVKVGTRDEQGFVVLRLNKSVIDPVPYRNFILSPIFIFDLESETEASEEEDTYMFSTEHIDVNSLRYLDLGGTGFLGANYKMNQVKKGKEIPLVDATIQLKNHPNLPYKLRGELKSGVLRNSIVPTNSKEGLIFEVNKKGYKPGIVEIDPIAVYPKFSKAKNLKVEEDKKAWTNLAMALKWKDTQTIPGTFHRVSSLQFDVDPSYAMVRDGLPAPGEDEDIVEKLNEIIEKNDPEKMKKVFGSTAPFNVSYQVKITDLNTGKSMDLKSKLKTATPVQIDYKDGNIKNGKVFIRFPNQDNNIYQVKVIATLSDSFGHRFSKTYTVYSHYLKTGGNQKYEDWLFTALTNKKPVSKTIFQKPTLKYKDQRILGIMHETHLNDGKYTMEELIRLRKAALGNQVKNQGKR